MSQKQQQASVSLTDKEQFVPQSNKVSIQVQYGSTTESYDAVAGQTLGEVLADARLREACGYGSLKDSNAQVHYVVGDKLVDENYVVKKGELYEVLKSAGEKA